MHDVAESCPSRPRKLIGRSIPDIDRFARLNPELLGHPPVRPQVGLHRSDVAGSPEHGDVTRQRRLGPASNFPLMAVAQHADRSPTRQLGHQLDDSRLWGTQRLVLAYTENLVDTRPLVCSERLAFRLAEPLHQRNEVDRRRLSLNIGRGPEPAEPAAIQPANVGDSLHPSEPGQAKLLWIDQRMEQIKDESSPTSHQPSVPKLDDPAGACSELLESRTRSGSPAPREGSHLASQLELRHDLLKRVPVTGGGNHA